MKAITRRRRITGVWIILLAATAFSWTIGQKWLSLGAHQAGICVVIIAFLKIRYVLLDFMEIRNSPIMMRVAAEVWVVCVCSTVLVFYVGW